MAGIVELAGFYGISVGSLILIIGVLVLVSIFNGVMKIIGMWKSARNNQIAWFIVLAIFNTMGILPIIYIIWFQKNKKGKKKR